MEITYRNPKQTIVEIDTLHPGKVFKRVDGNLDKVYMVIRQDSDNTVMVFDFKSNTYDYIRNGTPVVPFKSELVIYTSKDDIDREGDE